MAVNQLEILKHNLKTQNEHGRALVAVIERVEGVEDNVNEKYGEIKAMVTEVRDRVYIEHEDQKELQSIVGKKSYAIAGEYYNNDDDYGAEIREMAGYAIRHHWKTLKKEFKISRYTSIRHVDRMRAKEFARNIELGKEFLNSYKKWKIQRIKKKQRETESLKGDKQ